MHLHVNQSTYVRCCSDALFHHLSKHHNFTLNNVHEGLQIKEITLQDIGEAIVNDNIIVYTWKASGQILFAFINDRGKQVFNAKLSLHESAKLKIHNDIISKL